MFSTRSAIAVLSTFVTVVGLSACNSHSAPTEENFKAAVQTYLNKQRGVCVSSPSDTFPFDEPKSVHLVVNAFDRAQALSSADLLKASGEKIPLHVDKSVMVDGAHFDLTENGKKYLVPAGQVSMFPAFCGGKPDLRELGIVTPPTGKDVGSRAIVRIGYVVTDAPPWARNAEMQNVFSDDLRAVNQTTYQQLLIELTKDGWTAAY